MKDFCPPKKIIKMVIKLERHQVFFLTIKVCCVFDVWGFWNIISIKLLLMMIGLEKYVNSSVGLKTDGKSEADCTSL